MKNVLAGTAVALALFASSVSAEAAYVCGLNPRGDNFLSLRTGPGTSFPEIDRLGPGTTVRVLDSRGPWRYVRARGQPGWAHSRYICY
jgi:uncharacterized protein YraI